MEKELEKVKDVLEDLGKKIVDAMKKGKGEADRVAYMAQVKLEIGSLGRQRGELYRELGELFYRTSRSGKASVKAQEEVMEVVAQIDQMEVRMAELEDSLKKDRPSGAAPKKRGRPSKAAVEGEAAPKKRGRPPKAAAEGEAAPKKRGRPPKAAAEGGAAPKKRGRPPKAAAEGKAAPKRRGRPPKAAAEGKAAPKRRGRPPKAAPVPAVTGGDGENEAPEKKE